MREIDVTRAWKDTDYRANLSADELANLPQNPAGELEFELNEAELALIGGGLEDEVTLVQVSVNNEATCNCTRPPACPNPSVNGPNCPPRSPVRFGLRVEIL